MGNLLWLTELGFVSHFGILSDFEPFHIPAVGTEGECRVFGVDGVEL
jgi:hypothetical protein